LNSKKPLIVRLRNFIGDVVLMLPALDRLERAGYELHCVGKGWARSLLEGHGWPITPYPKPFGERVATLKQIRAELGLSRSRREINATTFATSFSSALDMRMAGLRAFGYAVEGRSFLLDRSAPIVYGEHALHSYWRLAGALLGDTAPPPPSATLKISANAVREANAALAAANVRDGYVVIVPFAGGTFEKLDKKWPAFDEFVREHLVRTGRDIVIAPGPDEIEAARTRFPAAKRLEKLNLGAYTEVMRRAALTISNDTGPGHMAASAGGRLLSVLGPTKPEQWGALGEQVEIVQEPSGWPAPRQVYERVERLLTAA
jgi:heptosyltransferase II